MPNLSIWTGMGHLGRDAELKTFGDNTVCQFSMAVSKKVKGEKVTNWFACSIWGKRGESLAPMLTKGTAVLVMGELVPREYRGKNDELRVSFDVRVDHLEFAGGAAGERSEQPRSAPAATADDDLIPF